MNRIMLNDTILIKREIINDEMMADGLLVKPQIYQETSNRGTVIAVGHKEVEISIGDKVVFSKLSEEEVQVDGELLVRVHRLGVFWIERE